VEDACEVWGHQSGVMRSFSVTKEQQTSWLGVGTLEMAGQKTYVGIHTAYRGIYRLACNSVKDKQIALLIVVLVCLHCWLSLSSSFVVVHGHRLSSSSLSSWLLCNWLSSSSGMAIMMIMIIIIIIMDGCCT
jgi:hypothetical protein